MSTTVTNPLIDVHAMLRRILKSDARVAALVPPVAPSPSPRVYARHLPKDTSPPAIAIRVLSSSDATPPVGVAWTYVAQVECLADTHPEAEQIANAAIACLLTVSGPQPEGSVLDCSPRGVTILDDDEWTPPRARHIVSVNLTGRSLYGGT